MTLKEAIETGRPIKRAGEIAFLVSPNADTFFSAADIVATDWEVEQKPVVIETFVSLTNPYYAAELVQDHITKFAGCTVRVTIKAI